MATRKKHLYVDKHLILGYYLRRNYRITENRGELELESVWRGEHYDKPLLEVHFNYRKVPAEYLVGTEIQINNVDKGITGTLSAGYVSGVAEDGTSDQALGVDNEVFRYSQSSKTFRQDNEMTVDLEDYGVFDKKDLNVRNIYHKDLPITFAFRYKVDRPASRDMRPWFHFCATYLIDDQIIHNFYFADQFKVDLNYIDSDISLYNLLI